MGLIERGHVLIQANSLQLEPAFKPFLKGRSYMKKPPTLTEFVS